MKFGNMQDWQSDARLEVEGVKLDLDRGRWILMRRAGGANRAYNAGLAALVSTLGDNVAQTLVSEQLERLRPIFAKHVVLDWGGIRDDKGDEIPYSESVFLELMESAPDLWTRIRVEAEKREHFQLEHLEQEKLQMGKSSSGKRNGGRSAHA